MQDLKLAILIDADNISPKYVKVILDEAASFGVAACKRIYGDWSDVRLKSWKDALLNNSIIPIQQYSYTTGKNATDSAMIIDAMDILYSGKVEGFCLVSSDSDFTRLASRLREGGMTVIGMGEKKTPKPFIAACNMFRYLDVLAAQPEAEPQPEPEAEPTPAAEEKAAPEKGKEKEKAKPAKAKAARKKAAQPEPPAPQEDPELTAMRGAIKAIVAEQSDEDGWLAVSMIGNLLVKRYPDFDVRNFGFSKLTPFVLSLGIFEVRTERGKDNARQAYVRLK